jgi:hypothetical protein
MNRPACLSPAVVVLTLACAHLPAEPNAPVDYWGFSSNTVPAWPESSRDG